MNDLLCIGLTIVIFALLSLVVKGVGVPPAELGELVDGISAAGGTPLVVAERGPGGVARALGVIHLRDIVKEGIRERFAELRKMGIRNRRLLPAGDAGHRPGGLLQPVTTGPTGHR